MADSDIPAEREAELLYAAWMVIANVGVHRSGWDEQHQDWVQAAERWRDDWHAYLHDTANEIKKNASNKEDN